MRFANNGCHTCKTRHLKCDGAQPICSKCAKSRRTCSWQEQVIHIENDFADRKTKRPRGPRSNPNRALAVVQKSEPQPALVDFRAVALTYYLTNHLRTLDNMPSLLRGQHDDFLPLWLSKTEHPVLDHAVSALALGVFAMMHRHRPSSQEAGAEYQQLLKSMRINIANINAASLDVCLLGIFFMSRYEDAVNGLDQSTKGSPFSARLGSIPHHEGAMALLRHWKSTLYPDNPPTNVIKHTRRGLIRSALMRKRPLPEWIVDGASFGETGLDLEHDRLTVRLLRVREQVFKLLEQAATDCSRDDTALLVHQLDTQLRSIDRDTQAWANQFSDLWIDLDVDNTDKPYATTGNTQRIPNESDPTFAAVWNRYYSLRMLTNSTRLRLFDVCASTLDETDHEERLTCSSQIKLMANNLMGSLPLLLRHFGEHRKIGSASTVSKSQSGILQDPEPPYLAGMAVWPLTIASSLAHVDQEQRLWFKTELARVGRIIGSRVFKAADSDGWLEL